MLSDTAQSPEQLLGPLKLTPQRRAWITAGVMMGLFLSALEATAVVTAMPTVISSLGGLEFYSWVYSIYFLTATVTVPLWGRLSDFYGRRLFYIAGIGLFVGGSVLCGLSQSMGQLVAFRAIQGFGAGALLPLGMTIVGDIYSLERRARIARLVQRCVGTQQYPRTSAGGTHYRPPFLAMGVFPQYSLWPFGGDHYRSGTG